MSLADLGGRRLGQSEAPTSCLAKLACFHSHVWGNPHNISPVLARHSCKYIQQLPHYLCWPPYRAPSEMCPTSLNRQNCCPEKCKIHQQPARHGPAWEVTTRMGGTEIIDCPICSLSHWGAICFLGMKTTRSANGFKREPADKAIALSATAGAHSRRQRGLST